MGLREIFINYWETASSGAKVYFLFSIGYFIFGVLFLGFIWLLHKDLQQIIELMRSK
jgi:hypothetical protein